MVDEEKRALEAKLFRKLEGRDRLLRLAAAAATEPLPREKWEIQRLRGYLAEWVLFQEQYRVYLGTGRVCTFAQGTTDKVWSATEYLDRSQAKAMVDISTAIEDLSLQPDGSALRAALRVRLLNETVGAKVFRSGRLAVLQPSEVDDLADAAELALIPMLKKKGLLCDYSG